MSECKCGYATNEEKKCDGTHKVVKKIKQDLVNKINAINLGEDNNQLNAIGFKIIVLDMLK
jgi:CDGSH-type Zn-finger protein